MIKRNLIIWMILVANLIPLDADACSCREISDDLPYEVESAVNSADVVFVGFAESVDLSYKNRVRMIQTTVFHVKDSWKGRHSDRITTRIDVSCCVCGYSFEKGESYLIFGYEERDGYFSTSVCSLTQKLESAEEIIAILEELEVEE